MRPKEEIDPVFAVVFPTAEFTKNSEKKWVRALGEIAVFIPMFPWTAFTIVVAMMLLVLITVIGSVTSWWEDV